MAFPHLELWLQDISDDDASGHHGHADVHERARMVAAREGMRPHDESHDRVAADEALVARVRQGDTAAFSVIYEQYAEALTQFALHLTGNASVAEEVAAHVLSAVWMRRAQWIVRDRIDAYLFGAARTRVLAIRRDNARHGRAERALAASDISPTVGTPPEAPDAAVEAAEWPERLHHAIAVLPERYRLVAFLRWKHGLDYDQIAQVLDVTESTARQLVSRTLKTLRATLDV